MAKVVIGTRTLTRDPQRMTMLRADKSCAHKQTYTSVAFFSWGTSIIGKEVLLEWPVMDADEFAALDTIFIADAAFNFTPSDGGGHVYSVNMTSFGGEYFLGRTTAAPTTRKNINMTLLIMSVVS